MKEDIDTLKDDWLTDNVCYACLHALSLDVTDLLPRSSLFGKSTFLSPST